MPQPSLTDGSATVNLQAFQTVSSGIKTNLVKQNIPERNGNLIQFMGTQSEVITLICYTTVSTDISQLRTWQKAGTELTYNDDDHTTFRVAIDDLSVQEPVSKQANYREFTITLCEVS